MLSDFQLGNESARASAFLHNLASNDPELVGYTHRSEPAILIAESGEVIAWYLPTAVSPYNQVRLNLEYFAEKIISCIQERAWASFQKIEIALADSIGRKLDVKKWRTEPTLFRTHAELAGAVNLSPAWFQQGHSVGAFPIFSWRY